MPSGTEKELHAAAPFSVYRPDLFPNPVLFPEPFQIGVASQKHHFTEMPGPLFQESTRSPVQMLARIIGLSRAGSYVADGVFFLPNRLKMLISQLPLSSGRTTECSASPLFLS